MTAIATDTAAAVLELLDREGCAINMTGLVQLLPGHREPEIKRLTNDLYMKRQIARVPVMGAAGRYYVYYSLMLRPVRGQPAPALELEEPAPPVDLVTVSLAPLSPDQAVAVLERGGWSAEPEIIEPVERRAPDRRRLTALDVIKRWRLPYQLGRVVDIIATSRRTGMTRDDAALAIKMLRDHARGDQ